MFSVIAIRLRQFLLYRSAILAKIAIFFYRILDIFIGFRVSRKVEFLVSEKHKIVLLLNPKVASRSLIKGFTTVEGFHVWEMDVRSANERFSGYDWYVVVRNPVDRVRSCFRQKVEMADPIIKARIWKHYSGALHEDLSFSGFIDFVCSEVGRDEIADRHWKSQVALFGCSTVEDVFAAFDRIFSLDSLGEINDFMSSRYGLDLEPFDQELKTDSSLILLGHGDMDRLKKRYRHDFELYKRVTQGV